MKKIIYLLSCSVLFNIAVYSQPTLEKRLLFDRQVELLLPQEFKDSEDSNLIVTYPQVAKYPSYHFSNDSKMVNLLSTLSEKGIDDNGIPGYTDELLARLQKLRKLKIIDDGILLQDGKNIGFVKFSTSKGKWGFHYIFYTSFKEKLLIFEFSCPKKSRGIWETTIEDIANSIRIRET